MKQKRLGILLIFLAVAACGISLLRVPHGARETYTASGREGAFTTPAPPHGTVQVNEAEADELLQLPGVGETLAQAIIAEREANGPYRLAEDLMAARGIGPAKLAQIRPWLDLGD